ncbi:hypothetical protein KAU43_06700 [candidate division WOR-3 bacterium]|nr:hypothetical protein [candidate division WOR-3 bacterium]
MNYKINNIKIKHFGILKGVSFKPGIFNIILGNNESGKTTLLDSIIYSLFKFKGQIIDMREYKHTDVDITISNGNDKTVYNPKKATFANDIGMIKTKTAQKDFIIFRSIVIRGIDYELSRDKDKYIINLLRSYISGINFTKLKEKISSISNLTFKKKNYDKKTSDEIEDLNIRLKNIGVIKKHTSEYYNKLKDKNKIEKELSNLVNLDGILKYYKNLIKLKRVRIENAKINEISEELSKYSSLAKSDLDKWNEHLSKIKGFEIDIKMKEKDRENIKNKIDMLNERIYKLGEEIDKQKSIMKQYDNLSGEYEDYLYITTKTGRLNKISMLLIIITALLFVLSITSYMLLKNFIFFVAPIITILPYFFVKHRISKQNDLLNKIMKTAMKNNVDLEDFGKNLNSTKQRIKNIEDEHSILKNEIIQLDDNITEIAEIIQNNQNNIKNIKEKIDNIRSSKQVAEIEEFVNKLAIKSKLQDQLEYHKKQMNIFKETSTEKNLNIDSIDIAFNNLEKDINIPIKSSINKLISKYRDLNDQNKIEYALTTVDEISMELNKYINNKNNSLSDIKNNETIIKELYKANNFADRTDLELSEYNIINRFNSYELLKDAAILALDSIDDVENNLTTDIKSLINIRNILRSIEKYMKIITNDSKLQVMMNPDNVFLLKGNQGELDESQLSTGTYAQLMLCIRIAIAEKLFDDKAMFFIFDDILLTFDEERRKNTIKLFNNLIEDNWQIFYFTIDKNIKNLIENNIQDTKSFILK